MIDCGNANAYTALLASAFPHERSDLLFSVEHKRYRQKGGQRKGLPNYNLGWSDTLRTDRIKERRKSLRPAFGYSPLRDGVRGRTIYDVRSARRRSLADSTTTSPESSPSMPPRVVRRGSRTALDEWEKDYRLWLQTREESYSQEPSCPEQDTISQEEMEMFTKFINFAD